MAAPNPVAPWAAAVSAGVHATGSRHVVYVPDNPLSHVMRSLAQDFPDIQTTIATREEEAFGIAAGLYLGGARPTVMLQSSGLGNSLNAFTSLLVPYRLPVLTIISMRGEPGEWNAAQVPMGQAVPPILDAIGIPHEIITSADVAAARPSAVWGGGVRQPASRRLSPLPTDDREMSATSMTRLEATRVVVDELAGRAGDADHREPGTSGLRLCLPQVIAPPTSTPGAAWGWRRRWGLDWHWPGRTCRSSSSTATVRC